MLIPLSIFIQFNLFVLKFRKLAIQIEPKIVNDMGLTTVACNYISKLEVILVGQDQLANSVNRAHDHVIKTVIAQHHGMIGYCMFQAHPHLAHYFTWNIQIVFVAQQIQSCRSQSVNLLKIHQYH